MSSETHEDTCESSVSAPREATIASLSAAAVAAMDDAVGHTERGVGDVLAQIEAELAHERERHEQHCAELQRYRDLLQGTSLRTLIEVELEQ